jgi:hypothetical protein
MRLAGHMRAQAAIRTPFSAVRRASNGRIHGGPTLVPVEKVRRYVAGEAPTMRAKWALGRVRLGGTPVERG